LDILTESKAIDFFVRSMSDCPLVRAILLPAQPLMAKTKQKIIRNLCLIIKSSIPSD